MYWLLMNFIHTSLIQTHLGKYSLQIPLDVLGQTVLDASSDDLADNTAFVEYLKGIQIRTTALSGSVGVFQFKGCRF